MARFTVEAIKDSGEAVTLDIRADDTEAAIERLRQRGLHVVGIEENAGGAVDKVPWGWMNRDDASEFLREMGSLLQAGLSLLVSLSVIGEQGFGRRGRAIAACLAESVSAGGELSHAMALFPREFDASVIHAVAAGERSGTLPEVLVRLAEDRMRMADRRRKLLTALINPAITLMAAFAVVWIISAFLVPKLIMIYSRLRIELPSQTQNVLTVFTHVKTHAPQYLIALLALYVGIRLGQRKVAFRRGWHRLLLRLPIAGRIMLWNAYSEGFRLFGMLYRAGIPVLIALDHTSAVVRNQVVRDQFDALSRGVEAGRPLSRAAQEDQLFNGFCRAMLETGEQAGSLDVSLERVANKYDTALDHRFSRIEASFTPMLTIGMIIGVGYVVYALYLPFVTLIQTLSRPG